MPETTDRPEWAEQMTSLDGSTWYSCETCGNNAEDMIRSRVDHAEDLAAAIVDDETGESVIRSLARDCREVADLVENNLEYQLERKA